MNKTPKCHIKTPFGDIVTKCICIIISVLFLLMFVLPIGYVLISSVHVQDTWSLEGYALLLKNKQVLSGIYNSVLLAVTGTLYSLLLEFPTAYVLSKQCYTKFAEALFVIGQFGVAILPLFLLLKRLHLIDTLWALILPCGLSIVYTQLLRARMLNLSSEQEDAAMLDGCGPLRYLWYICLPNIASSIGVFGFFHFCSYWSSTLYARTFLLDESKYPLSLVLNRILIENHSANILGGTSAASATTIHMAEFALCVLSALPLVGVFLLIRKHINEVGYQNDLTL